MNLQRDANKHPDLIKLDQIGSAVFRANKYLPSVRRDSPAWAAWRQWFIERGTPCRWFDKQPPEFLFTVVFEYPPADLQASADHWLKGAKKLELQT